jgi:hypothetical protein
MKLVNPPQRLYLYNNDKQMSDVYHKFLGKKGLWADVPNGFKAEDKTHTRRYYTTGTRNMLAGPLIRQFSAVLTGWECVESDVKPRARRRRWGQGAGRHPDDIWDYIILKFALDPTGPYPDVEHIAIQNHRDNVVLYDALMEYGLSPKDDYYINNLGDMVLKSTRARDIVSNTLWQVPITIEMQIYCPIHTGEGAAYGGAGLGLYNTQNTVIYGALIAD